MFVLTQFNSASLNRHIKNTYHFSAFSSAFVDILAAEQTPDNPTWYQGTADAVRQCLRHIGPFESDYVLILSGDQLYQMDFNEMLENHKKMAADISIATIPVVARDASDFGIMIPARRFTLTQHMQRCQPSELCLTMRAALSSLGVTRYRGTEPGVPVPLSCPARRKRWRQSPSSSSTRSR